MNISRFKLMSGASLFSVLAIVVALAGTHGAVSVASCDYCKVKVIAEIQSDSLDAVTVAEVAKSKMIVAGTKIHINKTKTDKAISDSFVESTEQVKSYAEKAKDNSLTNDDELLFAASVYRRFNQTRDSYKLATNSLINDNLACNGSRDSDRHKQSFNGKTFRAVTRTIVEGHKQLQSFSSRSSPETMQV